MNPQAKFFLNIASIVLATLFIAPTAAIVASWNTLPGDRLYSTKRSLEKIALAITSPNYTTSSELQTRLIARRTDEATDTILKKSSSKGLDELRAQLRDLNRQIDAAPTAEAKQAIAKKAVTQLRKTRQKLAQTKTTLAQGTTIIHTTTIITTTITEPSQPEEIIPETEENLIEEIEATEEEIEDAIEDIETDILSNPDPSPTPQTSPTPTPLPESEDNDSSGQGQGLETAPGQQNDSSDDDDDWEDIVSTNGWARFEVPIQGDIAELLITEITGPLPWLNQGQFSNIPITSWTNASNQTMIQVQPPTLTIESK